MFYFITRNMDKVFSIFYLQVFLFILKNNALEDNEGIKRRKKKKCLIFFNG